MKALPSIAFNDFSGTAGNVTARSTSGGTILSVRPFPCKVCSQSQRARRNALAAISRAYKQLTDIQMKGWAALAEKMKGTSLFGKPAELTAHNAFVRVNSNRRMLGQPLLTDAPDCLHCIPAVTYDSILVTTRRVLVSGIESPSEAYRLAVKMSAGKSPGVSSAWNATVIITPGIADDWGEASLTALYNEKIGFLPKEGEKVFVELCWIDTASGMTGEPERTVVVCVSEERAEAEGFVERKQFTAGMLVNEEKNVLDMDIEIPGGTSQMVAEGTFDIHGYCSYFYERLAEDPDGMLEGSTMVFSRASSRPDFKPGMISVTFSKIWESGRYHQQIAVSHRAGGYEQQCEIFGSNPLMAFNI